MVLKAMGMAMVLAGIVHTGLGLNAASTDSHTLAVIGFVTLVVGGAMYLGGAIEENVEERNRTHPRE